MVWPLHDLPFLEDRHHRLAQRLLDWGTAHPEFDVVEELDPAEGRVGR